MWRSGYASTEASEDIILKRTEYEATPDSIGNEDRQATTGQEMSDVLPGQGSAPTFPQSKPLIYLTTVKNRTTTRNLLVSGGQLSQ